MQSEYFAGSMPLADKASCSIHREVHQASSMTQNMSSTSMEHSAPGHEQLVLNRGRIGYYRVEYGNAGYAWMRRQFHSQSAQLPGIDLPFRRGRLRQSGRAATIEVLDLLQSVSAETDVSVWDIATSFLLDLESLLWEQADEEQQTLRDLAASIIGETYREVGVVTRVNETA